MAQHHTTSLSTIQYKLTWDLKKRKLSFVFGSFKLNQTYMHEVSNVSYTILDNDIKTFYRLNVLIISYERDMSIS